VSVEPSSSVTEQVHIEVSRDFLAAQTVQAIVPVPAATHSHGTGLDYTFDVVPGQKLQVEWTLQPDEIGRHAGTVRLGGGPPVSIAQFTYP
jgi:hypothetical protein